MSSPAFTVLALSAVVFPPSGAYEALMVAGGYYHEGGEDHFQRRTMMIWECYCAADTDYVTVYYTPNT